MVEYWQHCFCICFEVQKPQIFPFAKVRYSSNIEVHWIILREGSVSVQTFQETCNLSFLCVLELLIVNSVDSYTSIFYATCQLFPANSINFAESICTQRDSPNF